MGIAIGPVPGPDVPWATCVPNGVQCPSTHPFGLENVFCIYSPLKKNGARSPALLTFSARTTRLQILYKILQVHNNVGSSTLQHGLRNDYSTARLTQPLPFAPHYKSVYNCTQFRTQVIHATSEPWGRPILVVDHLFIILKVVPPLPPWCTEGKAYGSPRGSKRAALLREVSGAGAHSLCLCASVLPRKGNPSGGVSQSLTCV